MSRLPKQLSTPIYTLSEASRYLGLPRSTVAAWARGYDYPVRSGPSGHSAPLITEVGFARRSHPTVPFVGFAEATFLAAVRRTGVPMQRIWPAIERLRDELGVDHALASQNLYSDGAEILYKVGPSAGAGASEIDELVVIRSGQGVFVDVIRDYLQHITYGPSGYAEAIRLPRYGSAGVVVNPRLGFGRPVIESNGVAVEVVLDRFAAGESIDELAFDFDLTSQTIEQLLRASRQVAA